MGLISHIVISEVNRASREKAARNRAVSARAVAQQQRPLPSPRPAGGPAQPATQKMGVAGAICAMAALALVGVLLSQGKDAQNAVIENEQTCTGALTWAPSYEPGLSDEIGPASLTPDPVLRGEVARLLTDVQYVRVVNMADVPTPQVKADLKAINRRCNALGLNPNGNDANNIP